MRDTVHAAAYPSTPGSPCQRHEMIKGVLIALLHEFAPNMCTKVAYLIDQLVDDLFRQHCHGAYILILGLLTQGMHAACMSVASQRVLGRPDSAATPAGQMQAGQVPQPLQVQCKQQPQRGVKSGVLAVTHFVQVAHRLRDPLH